MHQSNEHSNVRVQPWRVIAKKNIVLKIEMEFLIEEDIRYVIKVAETIRGWRVQVDD